jgi:acetyl-CoA carboxylase biotin carboxylase subunit
MVSKVLIANRGEIALRVIRACREMGIASVAVHSTADEQAMHVRLADESVCLGPAPAAKSYLNIAAIVSACEITGADAVHPGYGFLSENAKFADILEAHGITFIGPTADHINLMGDKIAAKAKAIELGIPVVPGSDGEVKNVDEAMAASREMGFPVLVKAASGGGGRGMKIAETEKDLAEAFTTARSEAKAAFGDDAVYIEKYLKKPRHIEIQVACDTHGNAVHLGERDCSLQRRHQKVLEEAPSTVLDEKARADIGEIVTNAMKGMSYRGVGTVEFLFEDGEFYFIEMNTRLQVEHPVTEAITGIDLVREQIRVAAGEKLSFTQDDIELKGHAIECRVNAENPETFIPSPGTLHTYHAPGGLGVRMDSAVFSGYTIPPYYDSLIGKLIVHADDREACLRRLSRALNEFAIDGVETTLPLFDRLLENEDFHAADYDIHWLENFLDSTAPKDD